MIFTFSIVYYSSRGMEYRARKSIFYQITAVNFFRPFSTIFDHFLPFPAIFCHCLPGYRIVHNKKRAETHDYQFRPISAMLT